MRTVSVLVSLAVLAVAGGTAHSHCEIPCGIYGDEARFSAIAEDLATIEKSMKQILELSADPSMNANQLQHLRRVRASGEGIPAEPYTSLEYIRRELLHSQQLSLDHGWRNIDVTGKSVEEVSREIIALLPRDKPVRRPPD